MDTSNYTQVSNSQKLLTNIPIEAMAKSKVTKDWVSLFDQQSQAVNSSQPEMTTSETNNEQVEEFIYNMDVSMFIQDSPEEGPIIPNKKTRDSKSYRCEHCGKLFSLKYQMIRHCQTHAQVKAFRCEQCDKSFQHRTSLMKHLKTHSTERDHVCPVCQKGFTLKWILNKHLQIHAGIKEHQCPYCEKSFRKKSGLNTHLLRHYEMKVGRRERKNNNVANNNLPRTCYLCHQVFQTDATLRDHLRTHFFPLPGQVGLPLPPFPVPLPDPKVQQAETEEMKPPEEEEEEEEEESQPVCTLSFNDLKELKEHLRPHLNETQHCQICDRSFKLPLLLKYHLCSDGQVIGTKKKPRLFNCTRCFARFLSKTLLIRHLCKHDSTVLSSSTEDDKKIHRCLHCEKSFRLKSDLKAHSYKHASTRDFKCGQCEKCFKHKSTLYDHIREIHKGIKAYTCPHCDKTFSRKYHLDNHLTIHTGSKSHECLDCGKRFSLKGSLTKHSLTHTSVKAIKCEDCGREFKHRDNLKEHIKVVHLGVKPYLCPHCDKSFTRKGRLVKHLVGHSQVVDLKFQPAVVHDD